MFETIQYELKNGIAWLTLNRPDKLNAFVAKMNREIKEAIRTASKDENVRCIVIKGAGRAFCSGQDLSEVNEQMDHGQVLRDHYYPMVLEVKKSEKPIIAAVNGVAAGAGFSLALACDFRLLSEKASFINAFIHVGLIPDSGNLFYLSQLVGTAKAAEISILGEKVSAVQALDLGLATKAFSAEDFDAEVEAFAKRIASLPTKAIGLTKRGLHDVQTLPFESFLQREAEAQRIAGLTADHREGVEAFTNKRTPEFIGK